MTITPSALLSLPIITSGTESGTWGDVIDNGLTSYLDIAIAGGLAIAITTADVTLANTAGTSLVTGIVSTTAQYAILNISGAKTAARNLNLPASSRKYTINNAGTGGFLLTVRGVTPTTGITLVDGEKAIVAWSGTDYVKIASSVITGATGTLPLANGGTGATTAATARTNLDVAQAVYSVPQGGIIIWSGSQASIPTGWLLCNGSSGTPDLRDRFVVGAGSTYAVAATGGSTTATLPSHTHTFTGTALGTHIHKPVSGQAMGLTPGGGGGLGGGDLNSSSGDVDTSAVSAGTPAGTNSTEGASAVNANLPPYYALCYIMKS
jgi:hypothetical protein